MYHCTITIKSIERARAFVAMTAKYPKIKIMLTCQEYCVDAHSIIGILSLDLSSTIDLTAEGDDLDALISDLKPFTV